MFSSEFAQLAQLHVAVISLKFNVTRVLVEVVKRCQLHVNFHKPDTNNIKRLSKTKNLGPIKITNIVY